MDTDTAICYQWCENCENKMIKHAFFLQQQIGKTLVFLRLTDRYVVYAVRYVWILVWIKSSKLNECIANEIWRMHLPFVNWKASQWLVGAR